MKMKKNVDVHCKPALTNVEIKPHSYIPPNTIISIFKGFLAELF